MLIETPAIWYQKMPCKPVLKKTVHNKAQSFRKMSIKKNLSAEIEVHSNTQTLRIPRISLEPLFPSFTPYFTLVLTSDAHQHLIRLTLCSPLSTWGIDQYWFLCVKLLLLIKMENQGILVFITPIYRTVIKPCC